MSNPLVVLAVLLVVAVLVGGFWNKSKGDPFFTWNKK